MDLVMSAPARDSDSELTLTFPDEFDIVNVASIPQRSPFRYAGGKTWFVPHARRWLRSRGAPVRELVEPFAGGAIISLTAVFERLCDHATLFELDPDVSSVWETIVAGDGLRLGTDICSFDLTLDNVKRVLSSQPMDTYQRAFATIIKNRVNRGGILAPGAGLVKQGENNRGLSSRWYPTTLRRRLAELHGVREKISIERRDGVAALAEYAGDPAVAVFIDPPYTVAGRRLYAFPDVDHDALFAGLRGQVFDFLMTYDDTPHIRDLARANQFDLVVVPMKTTHHAKKMEAVIGRDLGWIKG